MCRMHWDWNRSAGMSHAGHRLLCGRAVFTRVLGVFTSPLARVFGSRLVSRDGHDRAMCVDGGPSPMGLEDVRIIFGSAYSVRRMVQEQLWSMGDKRASGAWHPLTSSYEDQY